MTWLFSKAMMDYVNSLSSPERVAEYSAATSLDGEPSAQLNVMPTPHKFWRNDKTIDACGLSRFGLTSRLLTAAHGAELLTSFLAAFHVRTSAQPAPAPVSTVSEAGSGPISAGSFARYDHALSTWRTAQCSLLGDSDEFLETWPRWGSMRNGVSYLRPIPALPICESGYGLWPTPTVCGNHNQPGASKTAGWGLSSAVKLWQTPVADDAIKRRAGKWNSRGEPKLSAEVKLWPTPTASLADKGGRITPRKSREGGTLIEAISARTTFPTPLARDWRSGKASEATMSKNSSPLSEHVGGQLNPTWVEWLMGWPIGWTELKPLEMDKFHEWQQQHGRF